MCVCEREMHCIVDRDRERERGREKKGVRKSQRSCLKNEFVLKKKYINLKKKSETKLHFQVHLVELYREVTD